jgi:hypothetical protein
VITAAPQADSAGERRLIRWARHLQANAAPVFSLSSASYLAEALTRASELALRRRHQPQSGGALRTTKHTWCLTPTGIRTWGRLDLPAGTQPWTRIWAGGVVVSTPPEGRQEHPGQQVVRGVAAQPGCAHGADQASVPASVALTPGRSLKRAFASKVRTMRSLCRA